MIFLNLNSPAIDLNATITPFYRLYVICHTQDVLKTNFATLAKCNFGTANLYNPYIFKKNISGKLADMGERGLGTAFSLQHCPLRLSHQSRSPYDEGQFRSYNGPLA